MKFQIKHECRGRIRVQAMQQRMTLEQADMLEAWLLTLPQVERASVHERTRCAVIEYQGDRQDLLRALAGFLIRIMRWRNWSRSTAAGRSTVPMRKNWWYGGVKAVRSLFFPAPLRAVYTVIRSAPSSVPGASVSAAETAPCGVVGWKSPSACPWYGGTSTRPVP